MEFGRRKDGTLHPAVKAALEKSEKGRANEAAQTEPPSPETPAPEKAPIILN